MKRKILGIILGLIIIVTLYTIYPRELNNIITIEVMQENIDKILISIENDIGKEDTLIFEDEDEIERIVGYLAEKKVRKHYSFFLPFNEQDEWYMSIYLKEEPVNTVSSTHILWYNTPNIRKKNSLNPLLFTNYTFYKFENKIDINDLKSKAN